MRTDDKPKDEAERREPERRSYSRDSDGMLALCGEMLGVMDGIVAAVPSLHGMTTRLSQLRSRYDELRSTK